MHISRRSFLKGATASALLAGTHVLGFPTRARAAGVEAPILVVINLAGGNDFLNCVVPLDDVGAPQRSRYETLRPDLAVPLASLAGLSLEADPALGTGLALHPSLAGLHTLYGQGRLALVLGAGLDGSSLSHFEAEKAWFFGRPDVLVDTTGWIGRQLDLGADGAPHAVSFGSAVHPTFEGELADVLGVASVDRFEVPDDPLWQWRDGLERGAALEAILAEARSGMGESVARSGRLVLAQAEFLSGVETTGWGSQLEAERGGPGRDLRDVGSILRHDALHPGAPSGFSFFHLRMSGYDTHSRQGVLDESAGHPKLLAELGRALLGFQQDLDALGLADRVVTLVYSEFGRRVAQNANGNEAGTDHGAAGGVLVLGNPVVGGLYGSLPRLDQLDTTGNLKVTTDFRTVYAALIDDFLGGDHTGILPGAPFAKLPLIQA